LRDHQLHLLRSARLGAALELTNHVSAIMGIEKRHPFMDRRLIEYAIALPSEQRLRDGWTRFVMRKAMSVCVPTAVTWRVGKGNMTPAFANGLLRIDENALQDTHAAFAPAPVCRS
jgi:asparagine synthase (glutamine-hydrolysing)